MVYGDRSPRLRRTVERSGWSTATDPWSLDASPAICEAEAVVSLPMSEVSSCGNFRTSALASGGWGRPDNWYPPFVKKVSVCASIGPLGVHMQKQLKVPTFSAHRGSICGESSANGRIAIGYAAEAHSSQASRIEETDEGVHLRSQDY